MDVEINSHQIMLECLKHYGKGELFFRTDGLQFETRRAELRRAYLQEHPGIEPKHRQALLDAAATPGMTIDELTAAWGLLEEDARLAFGNVTEDRHTAYAYFNGFTIGNSYTLYLKNDVVVGIRESDKLVPPHRFELDMRLAEDSQGLYFFWDSNDGHIRGSDVDQVRIDWDTLHNHLYKIESVARVSAVRIEVLMKSKGLLKEYEIGFVRLGCSSRTADEELRSRIALSVLPYTGLTRWQRGQLASALPESRTEPQNPSGPIMLGPSGHSDDSELAPPEEWLAITPKGRQQEATFPTIDDQVEVLKVEWQRGHFFRVDQVPLLVNGVSLYDVVEVEWLDGNVIPHFKSLAESRGHRTVRGVVTEPHSRNRIKRFAEVVVSDPKQSRFEKDVLALTVTGSEIDDITKEWLGYLPLTWIYTDTLTQL